MSTEYGNVFDALHPKENIEVATGTGGIRLISTTNKIWLSPAGVKELIVLLSTAYYAYTGETIQGYKG